MDDVFHRPADWRIVPERQVFQITWDDAQVSEYAWEPLRRACPCAYCSGEGSYKGNVDETTIFTEKQTELKEVYAVGRYGLSPEWADGHDTGIYTFKRLRAAAGIA